jgi:hypothetical protein
MTGTSADYYYAKYHLETAKMLINQLKEDFDKEMKSNSELLEEVMIAIGMCMYGTWIIALDGLCY